MRNIPVQIYFSLLCAVLIFTSGTEAFAVTHMQEGINDYNNGQYLNALHEFMAAVTENKNDAIAHYYLANTLSYLNQEQDAQDEYKLAYSLAPAHSQIASYCKQAIVGSIDLQTGNKRQFTHQMVGQIRNQVRQDESSAAEVGRKQADAAESLGKQQAHEIQDRAAQAIADIKANPYVYWGGRGYRYTVQRTSEIEYLRQKADADARWAIEMSKRNAKNLREAAIRRQATLEESASNLESQFLDQSTSGVKLSALGTNLYVRNYSYDDNNLPGPSQSNNMPTPLLAKAKRLNQQVADRGHANELAPSNNTSMINTETKDTSAGVFGKVINAKEK